VERPQFGHLSGKLGSLLVVPAIKKLYHAAVFSLRSLGSGYFDLAKNTRFPRTPKPMPVQNVLERSVSPQADCFFQTCRRRMKQAAHTNGDATKSIFRA